VIWRLAFFLATSSGVGLAAVVLGRHVWGDTVAFAGLIALIVCLVPAALTLVLSERALTWPPEYQVTAILGSTAIRIIVVGFVALALYQRFETLRGESGFWTWILAFYLLTLALEVTALLWAHAVRNPPAALRPTNDQLPVP
jgi:hypothetical protein